MCTTVVPINGVHKPYTLRVQLSHTSYRTLLEQHDLHKSFITITFTLNETPYILLVIGGACDT